MADTPTTVTPTVDPQDPQAALELALKQKAAQLAGIPAPAPANPLVMLGKMLGTVATGGVLGPVLFGTQMRYKQQRNQLTETLGQLNQSKTLNYRDLIAKQLQGGIKDADAARENATAFQPIQDELTKINASEQIQKGYQGDPLAGVGILSKFGLPGGKIEVDPTGKTQFAGMPMAKRQVADVRPGGSLVDINTGQEIYNNPQRLIQAHMDRYQEVIARKNELMQGGNVDEAAALKQATDEVSAAYSHPPDDYSGLDDQALSDVKTAAIFGGKTGVLAQIAKAKMGAAAGAAGKKTAFGKRLSFKTQKEFQAALNDGKIRDGDLYQVAGGGWNKLEAIQ